MPDLMTVCPEGAIPDGESTVVTVNDRDVAVFFHGGSYFAIDDRCPHAGSSLSSGHVEDGVVACPWHGWRFRLSDGAWADNPRVKTGCYKVHVNDGLIQLEIPAKPG